MAVHEDIPHVKIDNHTGYPTTSKKALRLYNPHGFPGTDDRFNTDNLILINIHFDPLKNYFFLLSRSDHTPAFATSNHQP